MSSKIDDSVGLLRDNLNKVSLDWEIPEYFSLSQKADFYYDSPDFVLSRRRYCIRIYPNGQRYNQTVGSVGLYLRKIPEDFYCEDNDDLTIILGIKNPDGTIYKSTTVAYEKYDYLFGSDDFIERSTLQEMRRTLTRWRYLTVFCVVSLDDVATPLKSVQDLSEDFRSLYLGGEKADVTFKFNGKDLKAHELILQARSPVFQAMFENNWKEKDNRVVNIIDCDLETFHEFLLFLYSGKTDNVTSDNFANLYAMADKYQVHDLKKQCINFMKRNLNLATVCDIIAITDQNQDTDLKKSAEKFLLKNIKTILSTEKWKTFMSENIDLTVELLMKAIPEDENFENEDFISRECSPYFGSRWCCGGA